MHHRPISAILMTSTLYLVSCGTPSDIDGFSRTVIDTGSIRVIANVDPDNPGAFAGETEVIASDEEIISFIEPETCKEGQQITEFRSSRTGELTTFIGRCARPSS